MILAIIPAVIALIVLIVFVVAHLKPKPTPSKIINKIEQGGEDMCPYFDRHEEKCKAIESEKWNVYCKMVGKSTQISSFCKHFNDWKECNFNPSNR